MLGITFSPQNYHHHQQIPSKLRENNENDMTSAVWAVIVFGPRVWQLSAFFFKNYQNLFEKYQFRSTFFVFDIFS